MTLSQTGASEYLRISDDEHAASYEETTETLIDCEYPKDVDKNSSSFRRTFLSSMLVLILVATWVAMAECLQENDYIKAHEAFQRYLVVSTYSFCSLIALIMEHCCGHRGKKEREGRSLFLRTLPWTFGTAWGSMFFAGYMWYLSLRETMVALNNSLYQSQCIFVYLLSVLFLGELITFRKACAIFVAFTGVFLVSFGNQHHHDNKNTQVNTVKGVMMCLISAFCFAIYEVTVKYVENNYNDEEYAVRDSMYFLGNCGFLCLVTGPLMLWFCHYFGLEHFDLPPDEESLIILIEICVLDGIFNAALVLGVTVTSPYLVGIGLLLVIPSSFLADIVLGKLHTVSWIQIFGIVLIAAGFLILKVKTDQESLPGRVYRKLTVQDHGLNTKVISIKEHRGRKQ